ncbi:hypothetical protein Bbelb_337260 [Branchiostoma belcheri]|nr:hypothetical protein Bbelb_337260 [Branchiostoma belcheri]
MVRWEGRGGCVLFVHISPDVPAAPRPNVTVDVLFSATFPRPRPTPARHSSLLGCFRSGSRARGVLLTGRRRVDGMCCRLYRTNSPHGPPGAPGLVLAHMCSSLLLPVSTFLPNVAHGRHVVAAALIRSPQEADSNDVRTFWTGDTGRWEKSESIKARQAARHTAVPKGMLCVRKPIARAVVYPKHRAALLSDPGACERPELSRSPLQPQHGRRRVGLPSHNTGTQARGSAGTDKGSH